MSDHHQETRDIYQKQHERISGNDDAKGRIEGMYDSESFGIDPMWFRGKTAIDAGCGNVGALMVALSRLGVAKISGLEIGSDWIPALTESLSKSNIDKSKYELKSGSVLSIPYPDKTFDFVAINGVLVHLKDMEEIQTGFDEGARVCKPGGYYFTSYGPCGGVMQGVIFPALRAHYRANSEFKEFIDHIDPSHIHADIDQLVSDAQKHTGEDLNAKFLKSLFGVDFCVFLQNYIQAPTWWTNETTPEFVEKMYAKHGFKSVKRLSKYIKRTDIRKYFAPLHYYRERKLSKILYGEGYVTYIGQKE